MKKWICAAVCLAFAVAGLGCAPGDPGETENPGGDPPSGGVTPTPQPEIVYYTNPVFEPVFADPTAFRDDDGTYYAYGTGDYSEWDGEKRSALIPILSSPDLVHWTYEGDVFNASNRPTWKPLSYGLWAPHIIKIGDMYNLYYSFAGWADNINSAIGVAVAPSPVGPWIDRGCVISTQETGIQQAIDPFVFEYEGGVYMVCGSYYGMYYIELTSDGLRVKDGANAVQIGGKKDFSTYEGAWLTQRGDYWYLFTSHGNCCEGLDTNYYVQVARSKSPFGPFVGKDGKDMLDMTGKNLGLGTNVIKNSANFVGCGHNAVVTDDNGDFWIIYHAYDMTKPGKIDGGVNRRALCIDKLYWDDDWPHTLNNEAAYNETEAPYIANR